MMERTTTYIILGLIGIVPAILIVWLVPFPVSILIFALIFCGVTFIEHRIKKHRSKAE